MEHSEPPILSAHLSSIFPEDSRHSLRESVLPTLLTSITGVAKALRSSQKVSQVGTANAFGDDQLNVDVIAENSIRDAIKKCPSIVTASSEEDPVERQAEHDPATKDDQVKESYTIAFDPLDGSSIIAPNWTVGTIIGIWDGSTALGQDIETKQIASILGVVGPRTTAIVALRIPDSSISTCFEVALDDGKNIEVLRPHVRFQESAEINTRYFAPANLRAAAEEEKYMELITHFISCKYTLRYSGGLVPDIAHALVKGHGIYISPVTGKSKAKLRKLYEVAPIALIVECAGGSAIDPQDGSRILGKIIGDVDERAGLVCGTKEEVEVVREKLGL
ncbi:carbohydrate phosphatase [Lojkania enalia]|uniref:Carbohydrate phosphatase n=1 Tax=Lojkania enalia TaxID=147567 RepID=A0A9P4K7T9_9PLEO|nr:carbohydrate phosphatase [Didymosphaeria enalia]